MSDKPAVPPAAGDPSMEDILASIRRILSEDESLPGDARPDEPPHAGAASTAPTATPNEPPSHAYMPPPPPPPGEKDVLVLDPSMMVPEHAPEPIPAPPSPSPEPRMTAESPPRAGPTPPSYQPESDLVAPEAAAAAASSVGALMRTLSERSTQVHRGGPTIEDLVRDEIRPILKDWLDHNLPPIVERLVRLEIERVVGRAVP